jgi:hypothetical protein
MVLFQVWSKQVLGHQAIGERPTPRAEPPPPAQQRREFRHCQNADHS